MGAAEKLRRKMRQTKEGWTADDVRRLLEGHGFVVREGAKHRVFKHPEYPDLRATVIRVGVCAVGYIETALELLDELDARQEGDE